MFIKKVKKAKKAKKAVVDYFNSRVDRSENHG